MTAPLDYLIFDYSEDDEGTATWDAMANVGVPHLAPLSQEVMRVLQWADHNFPQQRGPIDEGASWDFDLQASGEHCGVIHPVVDWQQSALQWPTLPAHERVTLTLTVTGRNAFAQQFERTFEIE